MALNNLDDRLECAIRHRKGVNDYIYTWVTDNAFDVPHEVKNVLAWMPLPEPYREEGE